MNWDEYSSPQDDLPSPAVPMTPFLWRNYISARRACQFANRSCIALPAQGRAARARASEVDHGGNFGADDIVEFLRDFETAKAEAQKVGWEGDYRAAPRVFWLPQPESNSMSYAFIWKQDNNGTTFIVSPIPAPMGPLITGAAPQRATRLHGYHCRPRSSCAVPPKEADWSGSGSNGM